MTDLDRVSIAGMAGKAGKSSRRRQAGVIGAVLGVAAAGVATGVAVERLILRRTRMVDSDLAGELFGRLPLDESMTLATADGVEVYVEVVEPSGGVDPTIIFVHGFCLDMGTFHFQRQALAGVGDHRMVFYDQPGHGRSGKIAQGEYTLPMLARTLAEVIEATAPAGPVVLVGHSMGGMTVMALAEERPDLFVDRVRGVVFISTSAGKLEEVNFGMPDVLARFSRHLLPLVTSTGRATTSVIDAARRASTDLACLLTRKYGFGSGQADPALVAYVERMNARTSTEVVARYLRALYTHARFPALEALSEVRVLSICGANDVLTPLSHSEEIARVLPKSKLVVVPEAGHVALMEFPEVVNEAIVAFLKGAAGREEMAE